MVDSRLSALINERVAIEVKVSRRAAEVAQAWMTKHNRLRVAVDEERSNALTDDRSSMLYGSDLLPDDEIDDIDAAIGNLPVTLLRWDTQEPSGYVVTAAALSEYLSAAADPAPSDGGRIEQSISVSLSEIVNHDHEAFLDLITERAYGLVAASDIDIDITGHTAQTVELRVSAEVDSEHDN